MIDRQKLETILSTRFPDAGTVQIAAAANAIMGLAAGQSEGRAHVHTAPRPARTPADGSTTVAVSRSINAPLESVFEMFTDVEHAPEHVSGVVNVEMLTVGPVGLGTRWRESRRVLGRIDSADMEITAFDRYRTYTISHYKAGVRVDAVFTFESDGDRTSVAIEFRLDSGGLPPGLLTPLNWAIAGTVRHVLENDLADLKKLLEAVPH